MISIPQTSDEEDDYDPHVHLARRIVGSILSEKAEDIIPRNYKDRSRCQEMLDRKQKVIQSKSEFEQKIIKGHRNVFSSSMSPDRALSSDKMTIRLKEIMLDKGLYCYKPRPVPTGMRQQAKKLIQTL